MSDQDDDRDLQWTDEARELVRKAADRLVAEILSHAASITASERPSVATLMAANDSLTQSAIEYSDSGFELSGFDIFGALQNWDDEEFDDEPDEEQEAPVGFITILQRADYAVIDAEEIIGAGLAAHARMNGGANPDDALSSAGHIGGALYQIAHEGGWSSLDRVDGLRPLGSIVEVVSPTALDSEVVSFGADDESDLVTARTELYVVEGERLFGESNRYFS